MTKQLTVDAIAPLYDFPFTSARPNRHLDGAGEVDHLVADPSDLVAVYRQVAAHAASMIGRTLHDDQGTRALTAAVVAPGNVSANEISGFLSGWGLFPGVTVGTADRLQGGQWHAVIARDPLTLAGSIAPHHVAAGRRCVMASRHMTHLTWIHAENWLDVLTDQDNAEPPDRDVAVQVREALVDTPSVRLFGASDATVALLGSHGFAPGAYPPQVWHCNCMGRGATLGPTPGRPTRNRPQPGGVITDDHRLRRAAAERRRHRRRLARRASGPQVVGHRAGRR